MTKMAHLDHDVLVVVPTIDGSHVAGQACTLAVGADIDIIADGTVESCTDNILVAAVKQRNLISERNP